MPTPSHYSPLLFFSPCLVECIPHLVICRVTMWTSSRIRLCLLWVEMTKSILCFWVVLAYTYLIATLLCFFSILVHDGGLQLGSLLFDGNSVRNLWSVPSATWVDIPNFMLIASISCQHPNIIHRSYSSLHVWRSAFLTWWFVEWRCGQVPWIRLCLWWVEMSKLILCVWVVLAYTSVVLSFAFSPFRCMMVDWNWAHYFLMGTLKEICGVCLLQRELTCQVLSWMLAFHANTLTLFTALILLSMSGGVHSSLGDL